MTDILIKRGKFARTLETKNILQLNNTLLNNYKGSFKRNAKEKALN